MPITRMLLRRVTSALVATTVGLGSLVAFSAPASAFTWTRDDSTHYYHNMFGNTLIRHTAVVQWSGDGRGRMQRSPRALTNNTYAVTGISIRSTSKRWDWYQTKLDGTGQSVHSATFLLGIPTPWGNIGQTTQSDIINQVNGWGGKFQVQ